MVIMPDSQQKFYVLRAISGKENKVREYLEAEIKNSDLGNYVSQVLIPTEKNLVGEVIHRLREIPNVIGFLGGEGQPVPLRPSEVSRVLGTLDELQEQPEEMEIQYFVGETVKVISGPFNGFSGLVEEVNAEKKKLKVIVKIFGRKMPLELSYVQVEKE